MTSNEYCLGIDVSTSIIGYTILDSEGKMMVADSCILNKKYSNVEKAMQFSEVLKDLKELFNITAVWIEEPFVAFASGRSSAQVISKLASFNGMVQFTCFNSFGFEPSMINVSHARKIVGIKLKRGHDTKEIVLAWVKPKLPGYEWPVKVLKSGPRKGLSITHPSCYDIADSYVVSLAGFYKK